MINERPRAIHYTYMPGDTVSAAIKKSNKFDATPQEVASLIEIYKAINIPHIPKPGMKVLMPILSRHSIHVDAL